MLARVLNPADPDLIGMASIVVSSVSIFKNLGLSEVLLSRPAGGKGLRDFHETGRLLRAGR